MGSQYWPNKRDLKKVHRPKFFFFKVKIKTVNEVRIKEVQNTMLLTLFANLKVKGLIGQNICYSVPFGWKET